MDIERWRNLGRPAVIATVAVLNVGFWLTLGFSSPLFALLCAVSVAVGVNVLFAVESAAEYDAPGMKLGSVLAALLSLAILTVVLTDSMYMGKTERTVDLLSQGSLEQLSPPLPTGEYNLVLTPIWNPLGTQPLSGAVTTSCGDCSPDRIKFEFSHKSQANISSKRSGGQGGHEIQRQLVKVGAGAGLTGLVLESVQPAREGAVRVALHQRRVPVHMVCSAAIVLLLLCLLLAIPAMKSGVQPFFPVLGSGTLVFALVAREYIEPRGVGQALFGMLVSAIVGALFTLLYNLVLNRFFGRIPTTKK